MLYHVEFVMQVINDANQVTCMCNCNHKSSDTYACIERKQEKAALVCSPHPNMIICMLSTLKSFQT